MLYQNLRVLNRDQNRSFKLKDIPNLSFASATHLAPLGASEISLVARRAPVVFVGPDHDSVPTVLMGVKAAQNLLVDKAGQWRGGSYVPAFFRQYPFLLVEGEQNLLNICFDTDTDFLNEQEGRPLFEDDGEYSPFLSELVTFLQKYHADMQQARLFARQLHEAGILARRSLTLTHHSGQRTELKDVLIVDEQLFRALDESRLLEWHRSGMLGLVYAHLMSLGNAADLMDLHIQA